MARTTFELAIVSVEQTKFDDVHLVKLFFADEPDGERDSISSLLGMQAHDTVRDEVWNVCKGLSLGDLVRVDAEIDRGAKNMGKFIVLHVEPIEAKPAPRAASPQAQGQQQAKPAAADPAKG
jgi:hypothetical protein